MGNKGSRRSARFLPTPEQTVEQFVVDSRKHEGVELHLLEAELLHLRDLFGAHALNDHDRKYSYLDKDSFVSAMVGLHGTQFNVFPNVPTDDKEMKEVLASVLFQSMNFDRNGRMLFDEFIVGIATYFKGETRDLLRYTFNEITHRSGKPYVTEDTILNFMKRNMRLLTSAECQQFVVNRSYLSAQAMITSLGRTVDANMNERLKLIVGEKIGLALRELKARQAENAKAVVALLATANKKSLAGTQISYDDFILWAKSSDLFLSALKPSNLAVNMMVKACSGVPSDASSVNKTCTQYSRMLKSDTPPPTKAKKEAGSSSKGTPPSTTKVEKMTSIRNSNIWENAKLVKPKRNSRMEDRKSVVPRFIEHITIPPIIIAEEEEGKD